MNFYKKQILKESDSQGARFVIPDQSDFDNIEKESNFTKGETFYEYKIEIEDDFVWLSFDYGKTNPRDENLTNIETGKKRKNPRNNNEVEETGKFFVLCKYDGYLYTSDNEKVAALKYFFIKIKLNFKIKNIYISKDEFIKNLKEVSEINFTNAKNLFNQNSKERQALVDLTGTDAPETFKIKATYGIGFLNKLKSFFQKINNDNLIIKGVDEDGFERTYNAETFSKKIPIDVKEDNKGKYDSETVKTNLIQKLGTIE